MHYRLQGNKTFIQLTKCYMIFRSILQKIIRNSQASGQWADEESDGQKFPLSKRNNFDIVIVCEDDAFRVMFFL